MDCKILKKTLFISILAISLFYTGEVRAAQKCTTTYTSTPNVVGTVCKITVDKIKQNANFYEFYLDGNVALCLNAGKSMQSGSGKNGANEYALESTSQVTNPWMQKAYAYAVADSSNIAKRIVAQTIVWYITQFGENVDKNQLKNAVCSAVTSAQKGECNKKITLDCNAAVDDVEKIQNIIPIYSWERVTKGGNYQRLVSQLSGKFVKGYIKKVTGHAYGGNQNLNVGLSLEEIPTITPGEIVPDTTCESECNIKTEVNEASCGTSSFASSSSAGRIYQVSTGSTCSDGIDRENKITNDGDLVGDLNEVNKTYYQVHCFSEFLQQYPGNVTTPISTGGYLVWPNNNMNEIVKKAGLQEYPLRLMYSKICKMDVDSDKLKEKYSAEKTSLTNQDNNATGNARVGVDFFKQNKNCTQLNNDTKAYKNTLDTCQTNCSSSCDTTFNCQDITDESQKNECNISKNACNNSCSSPTGDCADEYSNWKNSNDKSTACNNFENTFNAAKGYLDKWSAAIKYSNKFSNITAGDFSAKLKVSYTFETSNKAAEKKYNKKYTLQKIKSEETSNITSNTDETNLTDPLNVSIKAFSDEVNQKSKQIAAKTATKSHTVWYDLNSNDKLPTPNKAYVRKSSILSVDKKSSSENHITTIGFVNLPIPFDSVPGIESLNLEISNLSIDDSEIKNAVNNKTYTCKYQIINSSTTPCTCPENSDYSGMNLLDKISNNGMSCADAIQEYCYISNPNPDPNPNNYVCPPGTTNAGYSLSACINAGGTYDSCQKEICDADLKCPSSYNASDDMSAQYRNCVSVKINQGMSLSEAKAACNVFCTSKGQKIIYRTISLSDPFPSYDSDYTVTQKGLEVGMFNDNIKGRYPGLNWSGTTVVKNKILNNRGVDGDKVYTKTPLYTFKLDARVIKNIRDYNKNHKYSDFTLNCKMGNAAACVSTEFVHNTAYGLTDGTCKNATAKNNFYTCDA